MLPQDAYAERRRRREERREKQRAQNVVRAQAMHIARLAAETSSEATSSSRRTPGSRTVPGSRAGRNDGNLHIGCSGWYYWHWGGTFYPSSIPRTGWFPHYAKHFDTVELNAPFYSWPTPAIVATWKKQAGRRKFVYAIKANELITHTKRFSRTATLVKDFGYIAELLGPHFGCFIFQLPPSFRYSARALDRILKQLDPRWRNVVEFRHKSWWNDRVFSAFSHANAVFCSVSAPRLPDELVKTSDAVYIRFHGTSSRWYRHDYTKEEIAAWVDKIRESGAKEVWAYFNNDRECNAIRNAQELRRQLTRPTPPRSSGSLRSASISRGPASRAQ